jgi:hypothetical protein
MVSGAWAVYLDRAVWTVLCPGCFLLTGLSVLTTLDRADLTLLGSPAATGKQFDGAFVLKKRRGATLETFGSRYYCYRWLMTVAGCVL